MSKVFMLNRISLDPDGYFNVADFIGASLCKEKLINLVDGVLVDISLDEILTDKVNSKYEINEYFELSEATLL